HRERAQFFEVPGGDVVLLARVEVALPSGEGAQIVVGPNCRIDDDRARLVLLGEPGGEVAAERAADERELAPAGVRIDPRAYIADRLRRPMRKLRQMKERLCAQARRRARDELSLHRLRCRVEAVQVDDRRSGHWCTPTLAADA